VLVQQSVSRLFPLGLVDRWLTKSKKHYVGSTWPPVKLKAALRCSAKNGYRGVIAGLEGVTGKKAVNSDAMTVKN
jgi:hypothetical protein